MLTSIPAPVVGRSRGSILRLVDHLELVDKTGLDAYDTAWDTNTRQIAGPGNRYGAKEKEATIAIENAMLEGQYI